MQVRNQEFLRAGEVSCNESTPIIILSTTHQRKTPQGKIFEVFSFLDLRRLLLKLNFKLGINS